MSIGRALVLSIALASAFLFTSVAAGQTSPAPAAAAADEPSLKVGALLFADWTYQQSPESTDARGYSFHPNSFNVTRTYINVSGNLNRWISFRVTPDMARETGSGSSLTGSYDIRLKYAYAQLNLDQVTTKGSWVRFGVQPTPFLNFEEEIYRYRFQGQIFLDREGYLSTADAGVAAHWNFPADYGDVAGGVYNGEGYNHAEVNNQKAFMLRGTVRPLPGTGVLYGLRLTGFVDADSYAHEAERKRYVGLVTFEHPLFNAAAEVFTAKDRQTPVVASIESSGYSVWATPKLGSSGLGLLLRRDQVKPNRDFGQKRTRNIAGLAWWVPGLKKVSAAVMVDYDSLKQSGFSAVRPNETRYGIKMMASF